jgi:hypothetical protein
MKTSELTGAALDWAVGEASGVPIYRSGKTLSRMDVDGGIYWQPSTDWSQGGPIIEREELTLSHSFYDHVFYGRTRPWCAEKKGRMEYGSTPLIAAMRCYVVSKLGDEIEIPEELTKY